MKFGCGLPIVLLGAAVVVVQPQIAVGLIPEEINTIADKITVSIDGTRGIYGSGIIVDRQGNTYTVLTNCHVVKQPGNYTIQTHDEQRYSFKSNEAQCLPKVDLALVRFTTKYTYQVAQLNNSNQLTPGQAVYIAGYIRPDSTCSKRRTCYRFYTRGAISGRSDAQNGYTITYTSDAKPGTSGGPILDAQGRLVAVHGVSKTDPENGAADFLGIPIDTYTKLAATVDGNQQVALPSKNPTTTSPPATIPPSRNNNTTSSNFALAKTVIADSTKVNDDICVFCGVHSVAISPDGRTLVSGSSDKTIKIWNLATGQLIRTLTGHYDEVSSVAISPDGRTLASGSFDNTIKIWNLSSGQLIRITNHSNEVYSVAISPDGRTLASGSGDKTIKIWNVATGQLIRTLTGHSDMVRSIAISPDGRTLVSGSTDNTVKIWNLATGQLIRTLTGHSLTVKSVAISPDGRTLVSGSFDDTIKIWNVATGQLIGTLTGHFDSVESIAISPDGRTLASGTWDKTIKIWNLATGQLIRTLTGHSDEVLSVAISPDGRTLVSGSTDQTIKIWRVSN